MTDKLARPNQSATPATVSAAELPRCPECGGEIGFAANPGNALEWWRCLQCGKFFPVRHGGPCVHRPGETARCAVCGGAGTAVSVVIRTGRHVETTLHFCSAAHAAQALRGQEKEDPL